MKIRTGDTVKILSGKDRGKTGKVIQVFPREQKVVVEGLNLFTRHVRARGGRTGEKGQKVEMAAPLPASRVALMCAKCERAARAGFSVQGTEKVRICRKCKNPL